MDYGYILYLPIYTLCYTMITGTIYVVLFVAGCVIAAILPPWNFSAFWGRVGQLALFLATLLIVGAIWGTTIWGTLYRSTDYCGTDFLPFIPITRSLLDAPFGDEPHGLMGGTTMLELHLVWLAFAAATWGTTIFIFRRLRKIFSAKTPPVPAAA